MSQKKIMLTGGGTGGSVTPLLAIIHELRTKNYKLLWIGTRHGIEKKIIKKEGIKFKSVFSGKLRRYFSLQNFLDPFLIILGFLKALYIILKWKPNLVISAGGFVSVPIVWAAWLCRVPSLIHQQDSRAGLSNKLMAPFARAITVTFEKSLKDYGDKATWIGNETQCSMINSQCSINDIYKYFKFKKDLPVVFVIGGITGAFGINKIIWSTMPELNKFCQIIHITGNVETLQCNVSTNIAPLYYKTKIMDKNELSMAYAISDIVVSRAGMGTLTELSHLAKPSIIIPMPGTHQEDNAKIFKDKNAAIVLNQKELIKAPKILIENIKNLINNEKLKNKLSNNIKEVIKKGYNKKMIEIIEEILR